ncbi:dTDP-4-dehydrorhamnose 3,5-epimerase family protein [Candidatus Daviesbacteria bacterium]|nr:dTDP-4-dehydrorhamnose 3,5-epimerase family protein [Candidatus Daviesbacteria bacterium]
MNYITLKNIANQKIIDGVKVKPVDRPAGERGWNQEFMSSSDKWTDFFNQEYLPVHGYVSETKSWVARDENLWHVHPNPAHPQGLAQVDRWVMLKNEIIAAVADTRPNSPTIGLLNLFHMGEADDLRYMLWIPPQVLHGFMALSQEALFLNVTNQAYDPEKIEGRIPFEQAAIKLVDGRLFSWELIRQDLKK